MKGIIDRFEGDIVVIEIDGQTKDFPRSQVDDSAKQNDVVIFQDNRWIPNQAETEKRREKIRKLMDDVWED